MCTYSCDKIEARINEEYKNLREELKINRQFVFERPLLIVGAAFIAMLNESESSSFSIQGLPESFFIILLFYNLWFTSNRLRSNSRILGYIKVRLEGTKRCTWNGWETALSMYRNWCLGNPHEEQKIRDLNRRNEQHDETRFYTPLFIFHILVAFLVVIHSWPSLLTVFIYVVGFATAWKQWHPQKLQNSIEAETEIWENVLSEGVPMKCPQGFIIPEGTSSRRDNTLVCTC
jgi:hypothetical protein